MNIRAPKTLALATLLALGAARPALALDLTALPAAAATAQGCYLGCGNAKHDASNVIDGDWGQTGNTGLNSWNSGTYAGWVQVDFGAAYALDRIELYGFNGTYNPFTLSASVDGQSWTTIAVGGYHAEPLLSQADNGGLRYGAVYDTGLGGGNALAAGLNARYVRYTVNAGSPQWGYLVEMQAQGHVATAPVPEPSGAAMLAAGLGVLGLVACRRRRG